MTASFLNRSSATTTASARQGDLQGLSPGRDAAGLDQTQKAAALRAAAQGYGADDEYAPTIPGANAGVNADDIDALYRELGDTSQLNGVGNMPGVNSETDGPTIFSKTDWRSGAAVPPEQTGGLGRPTAVSIGNDGGSITLPRGAIVSFGRPQAFGPQLGPQRGGYSGQSNELAPGAGAVDADGESTGDGIDGADGSSGYTVSVDSFGGRVIGHGQEVSWGLDED